MVTFDYSNLTEGHLFVAQFALLTFPDWLNEKHAVFIPYLSFPQKLSSP